MAAAYSFVSVWRTSASPERCWAELVRMLEDGGDVTWWPGVAVPEAPRRLAAGESLLLAVRSPWGYRLRMRLTLSDVDTGRRLAATSAGDLVGRGRIELLPQERGTDIRFSWDVVTAPRWMNLTAPLLRPVFARAHHRVMRLGEVGLAGVL